MEPDRPSPDGPRAGPADPRTIPREQDAPRWLIVLMIALMLGAVAGSFAWIQQRGAAAAVIGRPAPLARHGPVVSLAEIVDEEAEANLLGRDVAIRGARVQDVTGDWLFWVAAGEGRAVPVVLLGEQTARQRDARIEVRPGDTLALFGTVRAVRSLSTLDRPATMTPAERARLAAARVYISALRVEHTGRRDDATP